jgi:sulfate adenylyltransferase subunit 1
LLGIQHIVVAVNKMDLMGYSEDVFSDICIQYNELAQTLNIPNITYIPMSALNGDNVVDRSENMTWYDGPTLLHHLETVGSSTGNPAGDVSGKIAGTTGRFPVQYVIRPQTAELHDYRGYTGRIESGTFRVGDAISVLPSGETSTIKRIEFFEQSLDEAGTGQSVILHLTNNVDISRGDLIVSATNPPILSQNLDGMLCWMDSKALTVGSKYLLQHGTARVRCVVREIPYRLDIETYDRIANPDDLKLNDLARVVLKTARPIAFDPYSENRSNGAAILIDETSHVTVGAVMLSGEA